MGNSDEVTDGVYADKVLRELAGIAFAAPRPASKNDPYEPELKLGDKLRALEMLGKHLGIWDGASGRTDEAVYIVDDI